jgi:hypothetical protein
MKAVYYIFYECNGKVKSCLFFKYTTTSVYYVYICRYNMSAIYFRDDKAIMYYCMQGSM